MVLKLSDPSLHLRNISTDDEDILCEIYSSTRTAELEQLTDWTSSQKKAFLQGQFIAQHTYYQNHYKDAHFWVIEFRAQIIGRLYIDTCHEGKSLRIIDISLLPEWRNKGIGKQILLDIMELAVDTNRSITIHVESFNPAMNLYKGLGFVLVSETNGVYHLLEWKADSQALQKKLSFKQPITHGSRITAFNSR
jgi:GNAT superfamily N-acetyltransferase